MGSTSTFHNATSELRERERERDVSTQYQDAKKFWTYSKKFGVLTNWRIFPTFKYMKDLPSLRVFFNIKES